MAVFYYKARNRKGQLIEGQREAAQIQQVAAFLRDEGLFIVDITDKAPVTLDFKKWLTRRTKPIKEGEMAAFCRQLAVMQEAGIPLLTGLQQLADQAANGRLKKALQEVIKDISGGRTLAEAAGRQDTVFSPVFVHMIGAGELGGILDEVLVRLAEHFDREHQIKEKIKTAMIYPLGITCVALLAVVVLLTYVLPKFVNILQGMNVELPLPTRIALGASHLLNTYWYLALLLLGIVVLGLRHWFATSQGKFFLDRLVLKVPGFGKFSRSIILARFTRTLGTLLKTGVQVLPALEIVSKVVANEIVAAEILKARQAVQDGRSITSPLVNSRFFPPMVIQMMQVGEESGSLDMMLIKVSGHYEQEVDEMAERLSKLVEPVLLVFLGGFIGFILVSILMPMFSVFTNIGQQ